MNLPKIILTDIDGVWTDGGMYYDNQDNEFKKFHTYDSAGVVFSRILGIKVGIITGEQTAIVARRAKKLNIDLVWQGIKDKLSVVQEYCETQNISLQDVAYIGDDLNDYHLLKAVGFSACPANAPAYISDIVNFRCCKKGGEGVFREFVEHILQQNGVLDDVIRQVLSGNTVNTKQISS